jgi:hypothetical protein
MFNNPFVIQKSCHGKKHGNMFTTLSLMGCTYAYVEFRTLDLLDYTGVATCQPSPAG